LLLKTALYFSAAVLALVVAVPLAARLLPDTYPVARPTKNDTQAFHADRVSTITQLEAVARAMKPEGNTQHDLVVGMQRAVSARFVHGYSKFSWRDNPYVRVLDYVDPAANHASPMRVEDILQFDMAACSQQGLVLQEMLKRKGIEFATVAWEGPLHGHYAVAAKVDNMWRYYDPNVEPSEQGVPLNLILNDPATVYRIYRVSNQPQLAPILASYTRKKQGRVFIKDVNQNSAPRGQAMHRLTFALLGGWKV
jgi:hypothetical protein